MAVHTGIGGAVNGQNTVRTWQISETADNQTFRASNTDGATGRKGGNRDWTGSFTAYGTTPGVMPGESFTFTGYDSSKIATGSAIVDSIEISCQIEDAGIIEVTVNFSGNGALSRTTGSATDAVIPDPPSALGCKANWNGSDLADVRSWSLTITAENKEYRSSDTGGWTKREAGPIDATATVELYVNDLEALPSARDMEILKLYVSTTEFWQLKWAIIDSIEPETDIEGAEIEGASLNFSLSAYKDGAAGEITKPNGSAFWPAA